MAHPVAVGAKESKVAELCLRFADLVQRNHMVDLDVTIAMRTVGAIEVEFTNLTGKGATFGQRQVYFLLP